MTKLISLKNAFCGASCLLIVLQALADVQVLSVKNARISPSSPQLTDATGMTGLGVSDQLCVVNTVLGRGVRLTFVNANEIGADGISWRMSNTLTGETILYRQSASFANGSGVKQISGAAGGQFIDIPASLVAKSAAECPPNGNVIKWTVIAVPPSATAGEWINAVTLQATSL